MHEYRTHTCGELTVNDVDKVVKISGFLHNYRDHGGIIFLDIRDHYGITQVVIPDENHEMLSYAEKIPKESALTITGKVIPRPEEMINLNLKTGKIEIEAHEIKVVGEVLRPLPFDLMSRNEINEDLRLKNRFLDLRREKLHENIVKRSKVISLMRTTMTELGFLEITTPILTSSSPEGARDFIVPSRLHPGKFYALPQAPQQFKQLLMTSGFDKYFQIAPCFRDEDGRKDRTPGEFYQLDMEMAFSTMDDVLEVGEKVMAKIFKTFSNKEVDETPFVRIPYKKAMLDYGSDKPDLRNPLIIKDATSIFEEEDFKSFNDKTVRVIKVEDCAKNSRKFFDNMIDYSLSIGAGGLAWLKVEDTLEGPIAKFVSDEGKKKLIELTSAKESDCLFFIADEVNEANKYSGMVRNELAARLSLVDTSKFKFCWVVDYPMFELDEKGKIAFSHNPFSMPQNGMQDLLEKDPLEILAYQYDLVCNGIELASGAVRNHRPEVMEKAFEMAGYDKKVLEEKFSSLYNAFHYGAPPHAGMAPGIDRIIMLLTEEESIREVIAFPLNNKGEDLLMGAPGNVIETQLDEVHIKLDLDEV